MEYLDFAERNWMLMLALAFTIFMLGLNLFGHILKGYSIISPEQAIDIINKSKPIIIDVRESAELEKTGKIANAKHIALRTLIKADAKHIGDIKAPIIAICQSGNRSAVACGKLRKKGFTTVHNLKGGIVAWKKSGFPLTSKI